MQSSCCEWGNKVFSSTCVVTSWCFLSPTSQNVQAWMPAFRESGFRVQAFKLAGVFLWDFPGGGQTYPCASSGPSTDGHTQSLCTCWSHLSIDFPTCTLTIRYPYASPCLSYGRDVMLALFLFPHPSAHFLLTLVVYYADHECTASYGALKDIEKLTTSNSDTPFSVEKGFCRTGGTSCCFPVSSSRSPLPGVNGHVRSLLYCRFPRFTVSLRNEDLAERCFGCTGTRHREFRLLARPDVCKGPWSLRRPREMAMARASLVRFLLAWLDELQQLYRMVALAGVIIPAPSGGTPGRRTHGRLF